MRRMKKRGRSRGTGALKLAAILLAGVASARQSSGSVALLVEEPYGELTGFNPISHAAVYLDHVCAESPTRLRLCRSGESGVVVSRYHKIGGSDWIAVPLVPYLYAVDDVRDIPRRVDGAQVKNLRDSYWRKHLSSLAPPADDGSPPTGEWIQLVGSSYDRTIDAFQLDTTRSQDERFIAYFNGQSNVGGHFNLLFHNCADFARDVLDTYFSDAIHKKRADFEITRPEQVGRSLVEYGRKHPETKLEAFTIPQTPGTLPRSRPPDDIVPSLALGVIGIYLLGSLRFIRNSLMDPRSKKNYQLHAG
jgi:hypothetical protein